MHINIMGVERKKILCSSNGEKYAQRQQRRQQQRRNKSYRYYYYYYYYYCRLLLTYFIIIMMLSMIVITLLQIRRQNIIIFSNKTTSNTHPILSLPVRAQNDVALVIRETTTAVAVVAMAFPRNINNNNNMTAMNPKNQRKHQHQQNHQRHQNQNQKSHRRRRRRRRRRRLEFIHIPKTGGTIIESIAGKNGIGWTICHFLSSKIVLQISMNIIQCPPSHPTSSRSRATSSTSSTINKQLRNPSYPSSAFAAWRNTRYFHTLTSWWHLPPSYFFNDDYIGFNNNIYLPINPYDGADLFAIVRNPYDRIVSEYYYQHTFVISDQNKISKVNTVRYLNEWITQKLDIDYSQVYCNKNAKRYLYDRTNNSTAAYLIDDGHFIPQFDYIYDNIIMDSTSSSSSSSSSSSITTIIGERLVQQQQSQQQSQQQQSQQTHNNKNHRRSTSSKSKRKRIVDHVLKFETLHDDFHSLMNKYGLPYNKLVPLPEEHIRPSMDKKLGLLNLTLENVQLIERIYKDDFDEFGYKIQSAQISNDILKRNSILMKCKI